MYLTAVFLLDHHGAGTHVHIVTFRSILRTEYDAYVAYGGSVVFGQWQHIAVTFDWATAKGYGDGVEESSGGGDLVTTIPEPLGAGTLVAGRHYAGGCSAQLIVKEDLVTPTSPTGFTLPLRAVNLQTNGRNGKENPLLVKPSPTHRSLSSCF